MTIKSLFFCLFLYVCLVWVGAAYFNTTGAEIQHYGLLGTAIGLIAVLVLHYRRSPGWLVAFVAGQSGGAAGSRG